MGHSDRAFFARLLVARDVGDFLKTLDDDLYAQFVEAKDFAERALSDGLNCLASPETSFVIFEDLILVIRFSAKRERFYVAAIYILSQGPMPPLPPNAVPRSACEQLLVALGLPVRHPLLDLSLDIFEIKIVSNYYNFIVDLCSLKLNVGANSLGIGGNVQRRTNRRLLVEEDLLCRENLSDVFDAFSGLIVMYSCPRWEGLGGLVRDFGAPMGVGLRGPDSQRRWAVPSDGVNGLTNFLTSQHDQFVCGPGPAP